MVQHLHDHSPNFEDDISNCTKTKISLFYEQLYYIHRLKSTLVYLNASLLHHLIKREASPITLIIFSQMRQQNTFLNSPVSNQGISF